MKLRFFVASVFAAGFALTATMASADTLKKDAAESRVMLGTQTVYGQVPTRGMSMAQVERRFGAPLAKLDPRGGQKRVWPVINRWKYNGYIVYFERNKVIHTVVDPAAGSKS